MLTTHTPPLLNIYYCRQFLKQFATKKPSIEYINLLLSGLSLIKQLIKNTFRV